MPDPLPAPNFEARPELRASIRRVPVLAVCLTLIILTTLIVGLIAYLRIVDGVADAVTGIAEHFHNETITETFYLDRLDVVSSGGATLELATAQRHEIFTRKSSVTLWDQFIPLGTTESEINVPATYRYHIDLNDDWSLSTRDQVCIVMAPMFKPSLPVAIDTGKMRKKTRSGWARFDKAGNLDALEKGITGHLADRAASSENLDRVREACRQSVARFIVKWLLREGQWQDSRFNEVIVVFPDETAAGNGDAIRPTPSLRLSRQSARP